MLPVRDDKGWRWLVAALLLLAGAILPIAVVAQNTMVAPPKWAVNAVQRALRPQLGLPPLLNAEQLTPARLALGRKLFFDRRLSVNGTMSCAMCHVPEQGFANNEMAVAVGINGLSARRNTPTSLNVGLLQVLFQDGREHALETQYFSPLLASNEMANPSVGHVLHKLKTLADYRGRFEQAFGAPASPDRVGLALAAYQRSLLAGGSRFDQWRYGRQAAALSEQEQRGYRLFVGQAGCSACHEIGEASALFSDQSFHDNGYGWMREQQRQRPPAQRKVRIAPNQFAMVDEAMIESVSLPPREDLGRYEVTFDPADLWRYRTPGLRNVALTAPYMHDGGFSSLRQVLLFYNRGGAPHKEQSALVQPLGLADADLRALEAFLGTLTSPDLPALIAQARVEPPDSYRSVRESLLGQTHKPTGGN